jgi:hypothetical protein
VVPHGLPLLRQQGHFLQLDGQASLQNEQAPSAPCGRARPAFHTGATPAHVRLTLVTWGQA